MGKINLRYAAVGMLAWLTAMGFSEAVSAEVAVHDQELSVLYQQLMMNPADRELNLSYATLAAKLGDFEAAIPPLERILLKEPDNAWIKLKLGVMYMALGSKAMAGAYLTEVATANNATPEQVNEAREMLTILRQGARK